MAYTNNEYLVQVSGMTGATEVFTNLFCVLNISSGSPIDDIVNRIDRFYQGIDDFLSQDWEAQVIDVKNLGTGVVSHPSYEARAGLSSSDLLPTQLAIRLTLDDLEGNSGGPFLCGWPEASNDSAGLVTSGTKNAIASAVGTLASELDSDGMQLRINRPSVGSTVAALQARIGQRFDVIRKRANDTPENYTTVSLV